MAPLFAFVGRQLGRLVQMVFGWAALMLFGRVPQGKHLLLARVSAGALTATTTIRSGGRIGWRSDLP